ncbi:MAG: type secretion system protein [Cyanobacteria bacterium RYN_339]|nr:type secretion system protein [Cyanobacteria bacterium RYN_339]
MSPVMLVVTFLGIFAGMFGVMFLAMRLLNRGQVAVTEGGEGMPVPPAREVEAPPTAKMLDLATRLRRAGIDLEPGAYRTRVFRICLLVTLVGMIMGRFTVGGILFGLVLGFVAFKGGDAFINFKYNQRMAEFTDQFSDALGVMANGAKSGLTVMQSLETVAEDFSDPLRGEVEEVLQELRMGVPLDEALNSWVERMPGEDLEIATTALIVQRQTGGNVAEILDTLTRTIRERNKLFKQIRALTATGRMSGWVMSSLPVGMFLAMYFIAPARTGLLLSHPIGLVMTFVGCVGIATGSYFIKRIVTIEV